MSTSATTRSATNRDTEANGSRLHLRLAAATRRKIERAAAQSHKTLTQFVVEHATAAAERVLHRQTEVVLGLTDWDAFSAALLRPPAPTKALRAGFRRYRRLAGR